jgi:lysyl-tRNA synthetase class 2
MKKLLALGSGNIFQIGPVFREEELTSLHRNEFTMLEWYRVQADYEDAIRDVIRVIRSACRAASDADEITFGERTFDLLEPWEEITVAQAFERYAGVETLTRSGLADAMEEMGYTIKDDPPMEDLFFHVYVESVEPHLGIERPTIIKDYPSFLGTMAKPTTEDSRILERFEVYIGGLELANGYTELRDSVELARRMEKVLVELAADGIKGLTMDDEFLQAMADMPPCTGVSVGMDRLAMLALDLDDISKVVYPFE